MSDPSQKILIIGAGVFGLTTALHLARKGYKDVLVLDKSPYDRNAYDALAGAEGASSDMNKMFRSTYGDRRVYQALALSALGIWQEWTQAVLTSDPAELPPNISNTDRLFYEIGTIRTGLGDDVDAYWDSCLEGIEADGRRHRVFLLNNADELDRARKVDDRTESNYAAKLERFSKSRGGAIKGFLDCDAGLTRSDKACVWALHLARKAGVRFILDPSAGCFDEFIEESTPSGRIVKGVRTKDGQEHLANKTIIACGGWTASIVPETSRTLEATGGSLAYIQLPPNRPDLWEQFGPEKLCGWTYETGPGGKLNFIGFPRNESGKMKLVYTYNNYPNYEVNPKTGKLISAPRTKYSENPLNSIPLEALEEIKSNIKDAFPELTEFGIADTNMCWYTDTIDDHFLADYVPETNETLFIASGGSGHGQKFLPVLGHHFVNQLEHTPDQFTEFWRWRQYTDGERANGLEEGVAGPRVLSKAQLATETDWMFS